MWHYRFSSHLNDERRRGVDDEGFVSSETGTRPQPVHGRVPERRELEVCRDPVLAGDSDAIRQGQRRFVVVVEVGRRVALLSRDGSGVVAFTDARPEKMWMIGCGPRVRGADVREYFRNPPYR